MNEDDFLDEENEEDEELVSIQMSKEELASLITILSLSSETFNTLAEAAIQENNQKLLDSMQARYQISQIFAKHFSDFLKIPEPQSKLKH